MREKLSKNRRKKKEILPVCLKKVFKKLPNVCEQVQFKIFAVPVRKQIVFSN